MTPDYHSLLSKAIANLDRPDAQARRALYERARTALTHQLRDVASEAEVERQLRNLEAAVAQIEDGFRGETPPPASRMHGEDPRGPEATAVPSRRRRGIALAGVAVVLVLAFGALYLYRLNN